MSARCEHQRVVRDRFSEITGVRRAAPGHHQCLDCGAMVDMTDKNRPVVYEPDAPYSADSIGLLARLDGAK